MTMSIEQIAARLRETTSQPSMIDALLGLYADEINMGHTPPMPMDGPWTLPAMTALARTEQAAFSKALPNTVRERVQVTVEDNRIDYSAAWTGKRSDGRDVQVTMDAEFWVRDGRIVAQNLKMPAAMLAIYGELLMSGGFSPERLVENMRAAGLSAQAIKTILDKMGAADAGALAVH